MNQAPADPLTLTLADDAASLAQVGGKGASLAKLAAAGLPVPPGFYVTTTAYRRFVSDHSLQEAILGALGGGIIEDPATLDAASARIADLFAQHEMATEIAEAIRQGYERLGGEAPPVAVRSSATAEDLPEMSFAGQQESYLGVRGAAEVVAAVQRCWASLWTARAIGYRARHGIAPEEISLAVVVQEMVPAEAAGILFTAHPLTGRRDQVLINAAWGLGEAIVGGQVTPDTLVVDKASGTILEQQISEKGLMTVPTLDGTREEPVPAERRTAAVLTPAQAAELARFGVRIEALYGQSMDIEWALHEGQVAILQARPITALPPEASLPAPTEWSLPDPKGRYMRSSVFELLPDPLSPLFATAGLPAWDAAMKEFARDMGMAGMFEGETLATINGYGYYDYGFTTAQTLHGLRALPRILARVPHLLSSAPERWQTARARYAARLQHWQRVDLASASARYLLRAVGELTTEAAAYYLAVQSGILPAAYMSESLFTGVYESWFKRPADPAALTFMLGFSSTPIQAEKSLYDLAQWVRGQPEVAAALAKMSSREFVAAYHARSAPTSDAEESWRSFWQRLGEHLARFGHAIYDLDFAKPVLADDPVPLLETLKFFLSDQAPNPHLRQATAARVREEASAALLARLGGLRLRLARSLLHFAQRFAPLREDALADVGLAWPLVRRMLREIGERLVTRHALDAPDDLFWLTRTEVEAATVALDRWQPLPAHQALIAERRATWMRQRAVTPPVALPIKGGARFWGIDLTELMPAHTDQPPGDVLKGTPASPGRVTGPARVLHGAEAFGQMRQGEILVARITTPAWTPLFALAAGIVTDIGGPLSHSSIVAREYGIPAVLGTGVATERLHTGETITVDGDNGTVSVAR